MNRDDKRQASPEPAPAAEPAGAGMPANEPPAPETAGERQSIRLRGRRGYPVGMKALMALAFATIACVGLYQVRGLVAPAFFALTLVLTVRPIQRWLVKSGMPRWLAGTITILVIIVVLLGVISLLAWSLADLPATLANYTNRFDALTNQVFQFLDDRGFTTDRLQEEITKNFSVASVVGTVSSVFSSVTSFGSALLVISVCILFITMDMGTLDARASIVEHHDAGIFHSLSAFEGRVRQYWLVSSIFGAIVAVVDGVVLVFLGVPLAAGWAMVSFVTNYIPNIGFVIGLIPPALLALVHDGPLTALWVVVAYCAINASIQGVVQPKYTGDAVGLSATTTFVSLLFWALVVGPLGTILAVPLTLFAKTILVDASPQTRWLEVFLIPDDEAAKKLGDGFYDESDPAHDTFVDFTASVLARPVSHRAKGRRSREEAPESESEAPAEGLEGCGGGE